MVNGKKHLIALIVIVALAPTIASLDQTPFEDGLRGSCGAFFSIMARNHVSHGLAATLGIPVLNAGEAAPAQFVYYRHHPPLIPALLAGVYVITGESEVAARGLALTFHMVSLYLLAVVLWPVCGPWITIAAVAAAVATPFSTYYGPFMNFEVPCLAMLVATAVLIASDDAALARWGLVTYVIGGLFDWPIFLAAPFLAWRSWRRSRALAVAYLLVPLVVLGLVWVWQVAQVMRGGKFPDAGGLASYLHDTSPLAVLPSVGLGGWALRQLQFLWRLGSMPAVLAALSLPWILRRRLPGSTVWLVTTFFGVGVLNVFLFAGRSVDHDYYGLYFLPWITLGCGVLGRSLRDRLGLAPAVALLLVAGLVALHASSRVYAGRDYQARELAHRIRAVTAKDDVVFVAAPYDLQIPYYARRSVFALKDANWSSSVRNVFGLAQHRALFLVPHGAAKPKWVEEMGGAPQEWQQRDGFDAWVIDPPW